MGVIVDLLKSSNSEDSKEKLNWRTTLAYFLISSGPPVCLYFSYMYCGNILKNFGYSAQSIVNQNFMVSIAEFLGILLIVFLSYK
ncbi:hypothetical protein ABTD98_20280, partial [Acinetobacter baumannii]